MLKQIDKTQQNNTYAAHKYKSVKDYIWLGGKVDPLGIEQKI